jgi:hypothetical protein
MIAYKKKENFGCDFPWFPFTIQKMNYHIGSLYKEISEEKNKKRKEQLIRE